MSFVSLDRVSFSRDQGLEDTPMRLRAARCKSPTPASDTSNGTTPSRRLPSLNGSRVQASPVQQSSVPRHRPVPPAADSRAELLRSLDESVTDLRDELHNESARSVPRSNVTASAQSRINDICRKLDIIASVVLRHDHELKGQSAMVSHVASVERSRPAYPPYSESVSERSRREAANVSDLDASGALMRSILKKVTEVNHLMGEAAARSPAPPRPQSRISVHRDAAAMEPASPGLDQSGPLLRIADALDAVTREVQRQQHTIDRLVHDQEEREEDERIASMMERNPPSDVASTEDEEGDAADDDGMGRSPAYAVGQAEYLDEEDYRDEAAAAAAMAEEEDENERFRRRMLEAADELEEEMASSPRTRYTHTPAPDEALSSRDISVNEASPRRVRAAAPANASRTSSRISVNEESPRRARTAAAAAAGSSAGSSRISVNEESPRRARVHGGAVHSGVLDGSAGSGRISVNEQSPRRARVASAASSRVEESRGSRISADEASPRRSRAHAMDVYTDLEEFVEHPEYYEPSADEFTPQADFDPSPARNRSAARNGSTVAAKTSMVDGTPVRTATKQPEYIVRSASVQKHHPRKPIVRADIFDASSTDSDEASMRDEDVTRSDAATDMSTRTPSSRVVPADYGFMTSRMSPGAQDELIRRLRLENESLKQQLHVQLVKNDDFRSAAKDYDASPARSRLGASLLAA